MRHLCFRELMGCVGSRQQYVEIENISRLGQVLNSFLEKYNAVSSAQMKLELFRFSLEHVARIARV
jgi:hypothetical protein